MVYVKNIFFNASFCLFFIFVLRLPTAQSNLRCAETVDLPWFKSEYKTEIHLRPNTSLSMEELLARLEDMSIKVLKRDGTVYVKLKRRLVEESLSEVIEDINLKDVPDYIVSISPAPNVTINELKKVDAKIRALGIVKEPNLTGFWPRIPMSEEQLSLLYKDVAIQTLIILEVRSGDAAPIKHQLR